VIFIGIDPATHCGWAVLAEDGERLGSGTWDLGGRDAHDGARWARLDYVLGCLLRELGIDPGIAPPEPVSLAYERVEAHGGARASGESYRSGASAAHNYGGLVAVITMVCHERGVPYRAIPVATVKRAAGKGNLSKPAMITAAARRWRMAERPGEDEADALWIAESLRLSSV